MNVELYLLVGSDTVWQILLASRFPGRRQTLIRRMGKKRPRKAKRSHKY